MEGRPQAIVDRLIDEVVAGMRVEELGNKVSLAKVMRVKGSMGDLTVSPMDKGGKQNYASCGIHYTDRLRVKVVEAKEYNILAASEDEIMLEMKEDYHACKLDLIAPWGEESVPPAIALAKAKAPDEKERIVNSYAKGPARRALRLIAKALNFVFKQMGKEFTGWTLHSVTDAKGRIMEGNAMILKNAKGEWKLRIEQADVVNMYTNLSKAEIRLRVRALLDEAGEKRVGRGGRRKFVTLIMDGRNVIEIKWGVDKTSEENIVMSLEQIMIGVDFDLAHNFCGVGKKVLEQVGGCPIGGLCSATYANIYYAYDERAFDRKWKIAAQDYYAMRQMDDTVLVVRVDEGDEEQREMMTELMADAKNLYTGGPVSEVEDKIDWLGKKVRVWAGLQLRVGEQGMICKAHNKNEESILLHEMQKYPRYTHGYSYQGEQMRVGLMQGNAARLRSQDMLDEDFLYDLELDLWECLLIGTEWHLVAQALRNMPNMIEGNGEDWSVAKEEIRRVLSQRRQEHLLPFCR
jgi:hypothetical protein